MQASFWNRAERRPIDCLDAAASAAAIREPFAAEHVDVDANALAHVVRESHGYPYFLQIWGQSLWREGANAAAPKPIRRITMSEVADARADFDRRRDDYSLDRYDELRHLHLLPAARAVADAFSSRARLDDTQLDDAIRRGLSAKSDEDAVASARTTLHHLGYAWRSGGKPIWEPGIPSLMEYVRTYAPPVPPT